MSSFIATGEYNFLKRISHSEVENIVLFFRKVEAKRDFEKVKSFLFFPESFMLKKIYLSAFRFRRSFQRSSFFQKISVINKKVRIICLFLNKISVKQKVFYIKCFSLWVIPRLQFNLFDFFFPQ